MADNALGLYAIKGTSDDGSKNVKSFPSQWRRWSPYP